MRHACTAPAAAPHSSHHGTDRDTQQGQAAAAAARERAVSGGKCATGRRALSKCNLHARGVKGVDARGTRTAALRGAREGCYGQAPDGWLAPVVGCVVCTPTENTWGGALWGTMTRGDRQSLNLHLSSYLHLNSIPSQHFQVAAACELHHERSFKRSKAKAETGQVACSTQLQQLLLANVQHWDGKGCQGSHACQAFCCRGADG